MILSDCHMEIYALIFNCLGLLNYAMKLLILLFAYLFFPFQKAKHHFLSPCVSAYTC